MPLYCKLIDSVVVFPHYVGIVENTQIISTQAYLFRLFNKFFIPNKDADEVLKTPRDFSHTKNQDTA